ncbi:hypothetical protein KSC_071900 [Ktedonobacter sp. SOSP1-52]|uniref:hypothetical protein n=1 Tax=Ktedonobacter sp. SOSP1-52 TaxID=2778366 RepID=UPI00191598B2|nr:hypothetical protein [Ktedonobacter sp. SOSP1-52]GHO68298.1 hypothetical protein KSC_071900 [Ktedonobacter sp. SOSP1-52]
MIKEVQAAGFTLAELKELDEACHAARELRQRYTTGACDHSLPDERPEETVARSRRRGSEQEIEIRHVFS